MVSYFTEDAIRMPFNAPAERGREMIRAHFDAVDSITQWTIHESDVGGTGDVAYLRNTYTVTGFLGGMPDGVTYTGKSLAVLRRQPDGSWLFAMDIWNSDAPLEMPE
jgi:ketosteroid isomerase-like protein